MNESLPLWVHIFRSLVQFAFFLVATALLIWGERRLVARMQSRYGPNRVGPLGILQTAVDGLKLFFKEDVRPSMVDGAVYLLAPLISAVVAFLAWAVVPIGGEVTLFGETFTLQVADLNVGLLWFLAMGSINVYGIVLAGWASQSAYPLMGGIRSSAQMVSYEIAQGLALASVFIYAGTLKVSEIVGQQTFEPGLIDGIPNWFAIPLFPAFVIFFFGMVAETQRPPFDMPEAEGELVGGFHTEYSGMKFAIFMLGEYVAMIVMSAAMVTLFFGG
ncbi:MAG: NADH-quinone oxidoreductase subunit H, partial [Nitriliruptorales bacterium]|nr:NADH-quinone oxidoreductase subunit H [Nitriliruptorales bacterium]